MVSLSRKSICISKGILLWDKYRIYVYLLLTICTVDFELIENYNELLIEPYLFVYGMSSLSIAFRVTH